MLTWPWSLIQQNTLLKKSSKALREKKNCGADKNRAAKRHQQGVSNIKAKQEQPALSIHKK